ncbi:hypothetical protein EVAR_35820_1 [Eumeta japonica]|uniref:Mutator-like transposase domain-containing protein n=1 Tax=Eumeta variegata TaxID=151549 RepID=A0A4C1WVN7_EUMVA|nr:hypothetical protein EVAR_35820_1 [Eumeta japonica]
MGNKKNKRKRARLRHIETVRDNGRKTAAKRWSEHNKDIDEATSTTSNALETSSQHSTMDCVDDENGMSAYMELRTVSPAYMPLRTVTPTPCENSLDDNIQPLVQLDTVLSTPSQENESLIIEEEFENSKSETSMGRRVIDMTYFFERLQEISAHTSLFNCNLSNIIIAGEKRIGFISHFKFKCELCGTYFSVSSDDPNNTKNVDINTAVCSGIVATGIGYSQLEEICSAMDVPIFTEKYFAKVQSQVYDDWEATAVEAMEEAAGREYDAAIAEGRVKDGIPVIDVYVDGAWCTRSYGNNYRALSGVAAIVGRRFGEVLFIGVKNKYCLICARAEKKGETPKEHVCYKNYEGSSSGMEAAIICEGFMKSIEMYGLIYGNVIEMEIPPLTQNRRCKPIPQSCVCVGTISEMQKYIVLTGVVGTGNRYTVASKQRARECAIVTMYFASSQTVQRPAPAPL